MSNFAWLPIAATAALAAAVFILASKPRAILGPARLSREESSADILRIMGFALGIWALCVLAIGLFHQAQLRHHQLPAATPLSEGETVVYGALAELVPLAAMLWGNAFMRRDGLTRLGIRPRRIPAGAIVGLLGIAIVLPLIIYVDAFTEWGLRRWHEQHPAHELLEILKTNPPLWLRAADVISAGFIAPLAEETFFRGILQTLFRTLMRNSWMAIIFSAAAFALVHHWWTWPQIFFLGFCLGYAYERSGNLWISITMHAMFNLTSIYLFTH